MRKSHKPEGTRPIVEGYSRNIVDHLLEGCQIISPDYRYLFVNDAAAGQGRRPREQLLGRTMMEAYPGIDNTPMFSVLRQCMADRTPCRLDNQFVFPDGSKGWFDLRFEPVPEGVFILSLDITERKRIEEEQRVKLEVLQLINAAENWEALLKSMLTRLKRWSDCEAVAIRLKEGSDFPYFVTSGFPEDFVRMENRLCSHDLNGDVIRDAQGHPMLDCMCGNILSGRFDPSKSFFTTDGSFWSNCTTDLLATSTDADRRTRTRNTCNSSGYESVALIPLRSGKETFGLIQFNDKQRGRFTPERIALFRRIADHIANFLAKKQVEARITHLNAILLGIRKVNQLITREKDRNRLIQKACDLLVEARGFHSVVVGLTDDSSRRIIAHAGSGQNLASLREMLERGDMPDCARQAIASGKIVVRKNRRQSCKGCPGVEDSIDNQDALVINLEQDGRSFGFMVTCVSGGMGDNIEEQNLLREMAGDIAFALRGIEIESERDKSEKALAATREQLRLAQKLEAVGQLAGGVAHDFNNILMVQMGYCDLLKDELKDEKLLVNLAQIKGCAKRAAALTRQLLAFSRKQTLRPKVLDLNVVAAKIEEMLRRLIREDIDLVLALEDGLGRVKADPGQIEQVIMNLAVNARDAMPQGGRLAIETANVELDEAYARRHLGASAGPHVMLAITDTGSGMDEKTKRKLFEPFFTTKGQGKGTGLGLATVYGIVKQSGGNIWVYSEPGKGSTFKIYLPRVEAEPEQLVRQEAETARGQGELVMVVEDEPSLRSLFAQMIKSLGYRVNVAANGGEALTAVEKEGLRPDLLITDVVMPGMSGRELAEYLDRIQPGLKVLYTSGYTDNAIVHHGVLDSQTPFLQKPFSTADLAAKIRELLNSR
jgi:signal transduction histidine kinase/GAF domain-containing protein/ActR/RegA family two-component response regulator